MSESTSEVWQDLSSLTEAYAGLGRALTHAAGRLQAPGVLPAASLAEETERLRDEFARVRDRACRLAEGLGVATPDGEELESLEGIAALLAQVGEAEERLEERRRQTAAAVAVLDRVLALRHARHDGFAPLGACHELARTLRGELTGPGADALAGIVDALAANDHPFADLLAMVDRRDAIGDDDWDALFDAVGQAFGRSLAAAVARGRIVAGPAVAVAAEDTGAAPSLLTSQTTSAWASDVSQFATESLMTYVSKASPPSGAYDDPDANMDPGDASISGEPLEAPQWQTAGPEPMAVDEVLISALSESLTSPPEEGQEPNPADRNEPVRLVRRRSSTTSVDPRETLRWLSNIHGDVA
jgi:hypothetical protein